MGVGSGAGGFPPMEFEFFCKKRLLFFSFDWEKTNFTTFGPTLEKFWKNPQVVPA